MQPQNTAQSDGRVTLTPAERRSLGYVLAELEWEAAEIEGAPLGALWAEWRDALRDKLAACPEAVA